MRTLRPAQSRFLLRPRPRAGTMLIVVMWMTLGLAGLALVFGHTMMLECRAAENTVAAYESRAAIRGACQYLAQFLATTETPGRLPDIDTYESERVSVGDASFWLIGRGDPENPPTEPVYGLTDEAAKLNLNTATREMLEILPGMTAPLAAQIIDWRDADEEVSPDGAETAQYLLLDPPYTCKNGPFETVAELRLLPDATPAILFGEDVNRNGVLDPNEDDGDDTPPSDNRDGRLDPGLFEYLTVYSKDSATKSDGTKRVNVAAPGVGGNEELTTVLEEALGESRAAEVRAGLAGPPSNSLLMFYIRSKMTPEEFVLVEDSLCASDDDTTGLINVNTAPAAVLACIPGIGPDQASELAARRTGGKSTAEGLAWVMEVLDEASAIQAGPFLTGRSSQYAADIAAVGRHGRGFSRVRAVIDASQTAPEILFREDLADLGWPLGEPVYLELKESTDSSGAAR